MANRTRGRPAGIARLVDFKYKGQTYQIDPSDEKVYQRFVEVRRTLAIEIHARWRSQSEPEDQARDEGVPEVTSGEGEASRLRRQMTG